MTTWSRGPVNLPDGNYCGVWFNYTITVEPRGVDDEKVRFETQDGSLREHPVIIKVANKSAYCEAKA